MDSGSGAPGAARNEKGRNELAWEPDYIAIPYAIFTDRDLSHGAKLLFGRLKLYAGKDGKAFPTHETLARELCVSDRQVRTLLTELKALNRIGGGGREAVASSRSNHLKTGRKLPIWMGRNLPI